MEGKHTCIQEKEIGRILAILENIIKEFYGNGNEGISHIIPKLETKLATLIETSSANRTAISALTKAVVEWKAIEGHEEKEKLNARQRTSIIISSIIGVSAIIVTIIFKFV